MVWRGAGAVVGDEAAAVVEVVAGVQAAVAAGHPAGRRPSSRARRCFEANVAAPPVVVAAPGGEVLVVRAGEAAVGARGPAVHAVAGGPAVAVPDPADAVAVAAGWAWGVAGHHVAVFDDGDAGPVPGA